MAKVHLAVYDRLGPLAPTQETIRQYHDPNYATKRSDLLTLLAIADVYGVKPADIGPELVAMAEDARDLLIRQLRCFSVAA